MHCFVEKFFLTALWFIVFQVSVAILVNNIT